MNVLIVNTKGYLYGGVEKYILTCCKELKKQGIHLYGLFEESLIDETFNTLFEQCISVDEIKNYSFQLVLIHKISMNSVIDIDYLQCRYKTVLVVHDHDYYCPRKHKYSLIGKKNCSKPYTFMGCAVCSFFLSKGNEGIELINFSAFAHRLFLLKKCHRFIVLSEFMKKNLIQNGFAQEKISLVLPTVDFSKNTHHHEYKGFEILYSGQLIHGKGVDLLIEALSHVVGDFHATIIGKGNSETLLIELIKEYGLEDKVTLKGFVSNTKEYYESASLCVIPSRWQEPFCLSGVEAHSAGIPVIAFNVGGISQWLQDKVNGILVEPENIQMMARNIDYLIANPLIAKNMGNRGKMHVEKSYQGVNLYQGYQEIFRELEV